MRPSRWWSRLVVAMLAATSCTVDAKPQPKEKEKEKRMAQDQPEAAQVRRLFDEAAACTNRQRCPAQRELERRAELPGDTLVVRVAFDVMNEANVRSFDRIGDAAWHVTRTWGAARLKAGTFDDAAGQLWLAGVRRMLASPSGTFVIPAYALLSGAFGEKIPAARQILRDDAIKPGRSFEETDHAAQVLREHEKDLTLVKHWLSAHDERTLLAGCALLDHIDHSLIEQVKDELPLLLGTARRTDLTRDVQLRLVAHVKSHEDNAFLPILKEFSHSHDAQIKKEALEAIDSVKAAEAARSK